MQTDFISPSIDTASHIVIRKAVKSDLPAMEWEGEFTHFRQLYAEAYRRMEKGIGMIWLLDWPGVELVGQAFIQFNCDRPELANGSTHAYLYAFRVRQVYRRLGLGTRLLSFIEQDLYQRGFSYLTLNVAQDNPQAQKLYLRLGYAVVAEEPGLWWYTDENGVRHQVHEPAWRMEKCLDVKVKYLVSSQ